MKNTILYPLNLWEKYNQQNEKHDSYFITANSS
jgi:hypothetical protein